MARTAVERAADLGRMEQEFIRFRRFASACLAAAAVAWGASFALPLSPEIAAVLRSIAEAGLVGGLADWFAVTALFRHPLGIPIPHTALVPKNRERIAEGVASYIDTEFLAPEMLVAQLRRIDPAARIAGLLDDPASRARLVDLLAAAIGTVLRASDRDASIRTAVTAALKAGLADVDLRPTAAALVRAAIERGEIESLIGALASRAVGMIEQYRPTIGEVIAAKARWYIPGFVTSQLTRSIADGLIEYVTELRDPQTDRGRDFRAWIASLPGEIETADALGDRAGALLRRVLDDPAFAGIVRAAIVSVRRMAADDLEAPESRIRSMLDTIVAALARELHEDRVRERVNRAIEDGFLAAIPAWREEIRDFVSGTLRRQDEREFTRRFEIRVGKDLQFIRINGTILGAGIGGVLYLANRALG